MKKASEIESEFPEIRTILQRNLFQRLLKQSGDTPKPWETAIEFASERRRTYDSAKKFCEIYNGASLSELEIKSTLLEFARRNYCDYLIPFNISQIKRSVKAIRTIGDIDERISVYKLKFILTN